MATNADLAELLFPEVTKTPADLEREYPLRDLPDGAEVLRFAPSPTGFLHTGSLFTSFIGYKLAKQTNGVFYLRIEDTDTKRTIQGSADELISQLAKFGIVADEGFTPEGEKGNYGPYQQSKRADIYKVYVKKLVQEGRAYPDFATAEDLERIREFQQANKILPGYYGVYARDRNLSVDERIERIEKGEPWVIRFKSLGDHEKKIVFHDEIRGDLEIADNDVDIVILKSDGLPTYHFAHVVDDHLMRTTIVSRGEEWIPSTPIHLELFKALGFVPTKYAHLPVIMKLDRGNKRKLSKRKDEEAAVSFFLKAGYPPEGLLIYLLSIANSNFEEWTIENKTLAFENFKFSFAKMALDGALFDLDKLNYFSKEWLSGLTGAEMLSHLVPWAKEHDPSFYELIKKDEGYMAKILNIEKNRPNPRKDYGKYEDVEPLTRFFYDEKFQEIKAGKLPYNEKYDEKFIKEFLSMVSDRMLFGVEEAVWWDGVKNLAASYGFAVKNKEYKQNPEAFKGSLADAAELIRIALTGSRQSPNLHEIIEILGEGEVKERLRNPF